MSSSRLPDLCVAAAPPPKRFRCETCGAQFQRNQHLRRHQSQHSDVHHTCKICNRSFKRSDVLRLHYSRCHQRLELLGNGCLPLRSARGRRRRACDRCAKYKRACDNDRPCSVCTSRNIPCTYKAASSSAEGIRKSSQMSQGPNSDHGNGSSQQDATDRTGTISTEIVLFDAHLDVADALNGSMIPDSEDPCYLSALDSIHEYQDFYEDMMCPALAEQPRMALDRPSTVPIKFLVNLTTVEGLASRFNFSFFQSKHKSRCQISDYSTPPEQPVELVFTSEKHKGQCFDFSWCLDESKTELSPYLSSSALESDRITTLELFESFEISPATSSSRSTFNQSTMLDFLADPLFTQTRNIWTNLRSTSMKETQLYEKTGPRGLTEAQSVSCLDLFSPSNIRRYLEIFWDDWYCHGPILHKPSYDPQTAAPQLLLAMCLIGASLSPDARDRRLAEPWFDLAEEYIFEDQALTEECQSWNEKQAGGQVGWRRPQLLQAALFIAVLRTWEPDHRAKTRIRRQRHMILISKVRMIGFSSATHHKGRTWAKDPFDWARFVATEELIRTFMFIYLVDCSYVIFNNASAKELGSDLACPDPCFQAEDAESCRRELVRLLPPGCVRSGLSVCESVRILYYNDFDDSSFTTFLQLDSLNLFTMIANLHASVLCQSTSLFGVSVVEPYIRNALDTWQVIWNARADLSYVLSMELQSHIIPWKRIGFFQHAGEYRTYAIGVLTYMQAQSDSGGQWPSVNSLTPKVLAPLLKYDETSMEQVASLLVTLDAQQVMGFL